MQSTENKETWFFINIDTLGISENSKILSIGALAIHDDSEGMSYDELFKSSINLVIDVNNQKLRSMENDTMEYWKMKTGTSDILRMKNRMPVEFAYYKLHAYLMSNGFDKSSARVFSRGFNDALWWRSLCEVTLKKENFIPFYLWRDVRTVLDVLTGDTKIETTPYLEYYSSRDCVDDYITIRNALKAY